MQFNNIVFFDDQEVANLYPLTYTKPAADLLCGIFTLSEKWQKRLTMPVSYLAQAHLSKKYVSQANENSLFINSRLVYNPQLLSEIMALPSDTVLMKENIVLAYKKIKSEETIQTNSEIVLISRCHNLFTLNAQEIENDFEFIFSTNESEAISSNNTVLGKGKIYIEKGAKVEASILNTTDGSIYIGKDAEIMEGCMVRGPFALLEHGVVKMGAKIYSGTTIGKYSKVGGEVNNSVVCSFSNKGHDGFLGNSVLGEWCNLGADSNNSNLKNNYEPVRLWNYTMNSFEKTGLQFCGLIMGDHSKCGINTMFNTGTVVGVSANIFGSGFPRNFVPSFSWGGAHGFETYITKKAFQTAEIVMQRRKETLSENDKEIMEFIFEKEKQYRTWENNDK